MLRIFETYTDDIWHFLYIGLLNVHGRQPEKICFSANMCGICWCKYTRLVSHAVIISMTCIEITIMKVIILPQITIISVYRSPAVSVQQLYLWCHSCLPVTIVLFVLNYYTYPYGWLGYRGTDWFVLTLLDAAWRRIRVTGPVYSITIRGYLYPSNISFEDWWTGLVTGVGWWVWKKAIRLTCDMLVCITMLACLFLHFVMRVLARKSSLV